MTVPQPSTWMLPAPAPCQGPDRCPGCAGAKITGTTYRVAPVAGRRRLPPRDLLVDEWCPTCKGCGRGRHHLCQPGDHPIDDDDDDPIDDDDDADGVPTDGCLSCHGRRHWVCRGFDGTAAHHLRMPCGCAEALLIQVVNGQPVLAPACPRCGGPPLDTPTLGAGQAFCGSLGCPVVTWDLFSTPEHNRHQAPALP